jgi:gamma-glutamylcyclotransferase (GGCT)/AIG2-like uncharacterized protein YtfP
MKYIAYGSNMSVRQMAFRCPDAKLLGAGHIHGARLEFHTHATVERVRSRKACVPVAVWEISAQDEERLDHYEGFPNYYVKDKWTVTMEDGTKLVGMIYLMNRYRTGAPTKSYYEGIRDAYESLGLGSEIDTVLKPALARSQQHWMKWWSDKAH